MSKVRISVDSVAIDKRGRDDETYITATLFQPPGSIRTDEDKAVGWLGSVTSPIIPIKDKTTHTFSGGYTLFDGKADDLETLTLYLSVWDSDQKQRTNGDLLAKSNETIQRATSLIDSLKTVFSSLDPYSGAANALVTFGTSLTGTILSAQTDDLRFADVITFHKEHKFLPSEDHNLEFTSHDKRYKVKLSVVYSG